MNINQFSTNQILARLKAARAWLYTLDLHEIFQSLKTRKKITLGLLGITLCSIAAPLYLLNKSGEATDQDLLIPSVEAIKVKKRKLTARISSPGTITYLEKAAINSRVQGRVEKIYIDMGQTVKKGQKLAEMEKFELNIKLRQAQAALNSARAQRNLAGIKYKMARRNVDKQLSSFDKMQGDIITAKAGYLNARQNLENKKEIYKLGGVSRAEMKAAHTEYVSAMSRYYQSRKDYKSGIIGYRNKDLHMAGFRVPRDKQGKKKAVVDLNSRLENHELKVADASLSSSRLEVETTMLYLKESVIISPIDGVIASRGIEVGEEIKQGEPLFTVVRMDKLLASTSVSEKDLRNLKVGQNFTVVVDAVEGIELKGEVYLISPVIDVKTRTAEVKAVIENKDGLLNPGMFVRCGIEIGERENAVALPETAIINRKEKNGELQGEIFVIQNDIALKRKVVLGQSFGDTIEIISGLKEGETVATSRAQLLKDGGQVKISRFVDEKKDAPKNKKPDEKSPDKIVKKEAGPNKPAKARPEQKK